MMQIIISCSTSYVPFFVCEVVLHPLQPKLIPMCYTMFNNISPHIYIEQLFCFLAEKTGGYKFQ